MSELGGALESLNDLSRNLACNIIERSEWTVIVAVYILDKLEDNSVIEDLKIETELLVFSCLQGPVVRTARVIFENLFKLLHHRLVVDGECYPNVYEDTLLLALVGNTLGFPELLGLTHPVIVVLAHDSDTSLKIVERILRSVETDLDFLLL